MTTVPTDPWNVHIAGVLSRSVTTEQASRRHRQRDTLEDARLLSMSGEGRRVREAAGVSLAELAAVVGVSGLLIAAWESGDIEPEGDPARDWALVVRGLRHRRQRCQD